MIHINVIHFLFFCVFFYWFDYGSDEKEIDFAEQLESVAYVLCGEGPITFEKFISIWNARGVSSKITCILMFLF